MTDETMPLGLRNETRQAADAWEHARGDRSSPGLPGQVLILPELDEPRVVWAVLRRKEKENDRRLLVAADVNPLVGSGDVLVTGPGVGALTLRCRFGVRVGERELGEAILLGTLPAEGLSRADFLRQTIESGGPVGTFSEQETGEDPEYQDWIDDVVQPAVAKLEARAGADEPGPSVLPFQSQRKTRPRSPVGGAWMRWAAVLAFVGLGAGGGFIWWQQGQEIAGLRAAAQASEAAHRQAIEELEASRADVEAQYQARLKEAGEDRARLESEHLAQLKELEAAIGKLRQATEVKNPLLATLYAADVRRGPKELRIGPEVTHLVLEFPVDDPAGTEFQLDVSDKHSGKQVLLQKGLRVDTVGEVRLGLAAALLPPGDYRLRLFRKEGGKLRLVREHVIVIEEEEERRPPRW
jgi:hypothetical protein